jgi:hypothetical protein
MGAARLVFSSSRPDDTSASKAAHRTSANHRTHDSKRCSCPYVFGGWARSDRSPFWRLGADHSFIARSRRKTLALGTGGLPCFHTPARRAASFEARRRPIGSQLQRIACAPKFELGHCPLCPLLSPKRSKRPAGRKIIEVILVRGARPNRQIHRPRYAMS